MSGKEQSPLNDQEWYVVKDETTDESVGLIDTHGNTREMTAENQSRVQNAFKRELLVKNGEVAADLGMCFDSVCSVTPGDPQHDALVLKNLGALAGLRPEHKTDDPAELAS